ncbi:VOC family protein [Sediminibacillus halophilus]|uniref:Lactoylglutathione lyase n=1 Tax=Sediminibacillus halophilus TaxID=482461 RepID=A0A1G9S314_9BACI|nr:VOC family protein [Sediminibacillus halophilus]SDM29893.1 lactoylglutathione lyase [Sediminibacillus halophilus]
MIKGIGHLALTVEDMELSLDFYCGTLQFQHVFGIKDDNGNPWIEYIKVGTGQFIELFYGGDNRPEADANRIGFHHLCLEVTDIEKTANQLKEKGIKLDSEPKRGKDDNYQCWVSDPDGNWIEFMEISNASPHWAWYD